MLAVKSINYDTDKKKKTKNKKKKPKTKLSYTWIIINEIIDMIIALVI